MNALLLAICAIGQLDRIDETLYESSSGNFLFIEKKEGKYASYVHDHKFWYFVANKDKWVAASGYIRIEEEDIGKWPIIGNLLICEFLRGSSIRFEEVVDDDLNNGFDVDITVSGDPKTKLTFTMERRKVDDTELDRRSKREFSITGFVEGKEDYKPAGTEGKAAELRVHLGRKPINAIR